MVEKIKKKINISYARYLKRKQADRYMSPEDRTYAEQHSERVVRLKKSIMRIVLLLLVLLIIWPFVNKNWQTSKINFQSENINKGSEGSEKNIPVMIKPRFFGNDDNGQPYHITADSGVSVSEKNVVLVNINGEMVLKDNSRISIYSEQGDYTIKQKEMVLNGGVVINSDKGYDFKTNSAYIKLNENMATGSEPVEIKSIIGDITSNGFIIRNSGDEIVFFGGVSLSATIDQKKYENIDVPQIQSN